MSINKQLEDLTPDQLEQLKKVKDVDEFIHELKDFGVGLSKNDEDNIIATYNDDLEKQTDDIPALGHIFSVLTDVCASCNNRYFVSAVVAFSCPFCQYTKQF